MAEIWFGAEVAVERYFNSRQYSNSSRFLRLACFLLVLSSDPHADSKFIIRINAGIQILIFNSPHTLTSALSYLCCLIHENDKVFGWNTYISRQCNNNGNGFIFLEAKDIGMDGVQGRTE